MAVYLLESAICLACFYGFYHFALRRETFFQWSRVYLLITPLLSLLLPALHIVLEHPTGTTAPQTAQPLSQLMVPPAALLPTLVEQAQNTPVALHRYDWSQPLAQGWSLSLGDLLWWIYGAGALVLLVVLAGRFGRLLLLLRRCRRERQGKVTLATSSQEEVPLASFFGIIFWSQQAQVSDSQHLLLEHELVHARQRHSLDVLFMELMVVVQWFNPLMHAFRHSLCAVHEYIADDYVVRHTRQRRAYAALLVQQAAAGTRAPSGDGLVNTFHSLIKQRLIMLAKRPSRPLVRARFALALPLAAALMLLFSFRLVDTLPAAAPLHHALQSVAQYASQLGEVTVFAEKTTCPLPPAEPEPTPYIFYWGQFQCNILHDPTDDSYFGSVNVAPALFRESVQREPRLWDGQSRTLSPAISLQVRRLYMKNAAPASPPEQVAEGSRPYPEAQDFNASTYWLPLQSDYQQSEVYASSLKALNDFAYEVGLNEIIQVEKLTLPNGKTAAIEIVMTSSDQASYAPRRGLVYNNSTGSIWINANRPEHRSWGRAIWDYSSTHDFITEDELWSLIKKSPLFVPFPWDTMTETKRTMTILPVQGGPVSLDIQYSLADAATTAQANWQLLEQHKDLLKPGTKLYLESSSEIKASIPGDSLQTMQMMAKIAYLQIVNHNDSKLPLGKPQRSTFTFEWGKFSRTVGDFYGVSQMAQDGKILPTDAPMGIYHYDLGMPDVFRMFEQTPHLWRMDIQLKNPRFTLEYKDLKATYDLKSGFQPAHFVPMLKSRMKVGEELVISGFEAEGTDLRLLKVILVPHEGVQKPLLPRSATPQERQRFVAQHFSVSPNPAVDQINFRFVLPQGGAGTLRISNALGQEVYLLSADFAEGENSHTVSAEVLKAKGQFFVTLETPHDKTTQVFVVQ